MKVYKETLAIIVIVAISGCLGADASVVDETRAAADQKHNRPGQPITIAYSGDVGVSHCIPSGPSACLSITDFQRPGTNEFYVIKAAGLRGRADINVSWVSSMPWSDQLAASIGLATPHPEAQSKLQFKPLKSGAGKSPLRLILPQSELGPDQQFGIVVGSRNLAPAPFVATLETGQEFRVEGSLTVEK